MEKEKMSPLPADIAEPIIAKLALTDSRIANLISEHFEPGWFANETISLILTASIKRYYVKHGAIPKPATVELMLTKLYADNPEKLTNASLTLRTIYDIDTTGYDREYLDEQILHYLKNVGLTHTIIANISAIQSKQELICLEKLQKITSMAITTDMGLDYFGDMASHMEYLKCPESRLAFGYEALDALTGGGMLRDGRCLITMMAGSGVGKSLFLANFATNMIMAGLFPVIISLEMAEHVYAHRIDSELTNIDMHNIKHKEDTFLGKINDIKRKHPDAKLLIKEYPPESISCAHIVTYIENVIRATGRKPDVLIVDYLNLLVPATGNTSNDNSYAKIGKVTRELRGISYKFNIPVITATQTNRGSYGVNVVPTLENTSESMGIVHVSDAIFAIFQNDGDRDAGIIRMTPLKNRLGGVTGKVMEFNIDYNTLRITDQGSLSCFDDDIQDVVSAANGV